MSYYVYVIALKPKIYLEKPKFRRANPDYVPGKKCYYVGYSSLPPKERYRQHVKGAKSKKGYGIYNKYVYQYHRWRGLRPRQFKKYNPIRTKAEAMKIEKDIAARLRKKGHAVWQH